MSKYTQEQINEAIEALEIYAHEGNGIDSPIHDDAEIDGLANAAWLAVDVDVTLDEEIDILSADALEAAARLREGKLPGEDGWNS